MGRQSKLNNKQNEPVSKTFLNNIKSQIKKRTEESLDNTLMFRKKQWTEKEDKLLIKTIRQYGPKKWSFIAQFIPGRIGKQCRQRWHNHLNPKINKQQWTQLEQWALFLMHTVFGGKWAKMTKILKKRTDNSIKNHWNSIMQKKIEYFKQKLDETLKKQQNIEMEQEYEDQQQLNIEINNLLLSIKNQQIAPNSSLSLSLPASKNPSHSNDESSIYNSYQSQQKVNQLGVKMKKDLQNQNILQSFRDSSQEFQNSINLIQSQENEALLEKNMSFYNSKVQSSDIGLQQLLQKYDHVPTLTKNASYNYFPSNKLLNSQLKHRNSYNLSNSKKNSIIDQNYQSPARKKQNYSNVFDQENQLNAPLPQPKELDSPLIPLLRRKSSRNKSMMSPSRFIQRKASSNQQI